MNGSVKKTVYISIMTLLTGICLLLNAETPTSTQEKQSATHSPKAATAKQNTSSSLSSAHSLKSSDKGSSPSSPRRTGKSSKKTKKTDTKKTVVPPLKEQATSPSFSASRQWLMGNEIAYIIYTTTNEKILITTLDLNRKTLDGRTISVEEEIFERIMYYEATEVYKITIPEDIAEKHFSLMKAEHGLTDQQIEHLFHESFYSIEEGHERIKMNHAISMLLGQFVASRVIISKEDIQTYYDGLVNKKIHNPLIPLIEKESFRLKRAFIPTDTFSEEQLKELVEEKLYTELLEWKIPYWIDADEIAEDKSFIKEMHPGDIYAQKVANGHEIFMLLKHSPERKRTFEDLKREIASFLTHERQAAELKSYKEDLLKKYTIVAV